MNVLLLFAEYLPMKNFTFFWMTPQIMRFMGPTWGPPGSCRPQMGPMLAPWTLLSGTLLCQLMFTFIWCQWNSPTPCQSIICIYIYIMVLFLLTPLPSQMKMPPLCLTQWHWRQHRNPISWISTSKSSRIQQWFYRFWLFCTFRCFLERT